MENSEKFSLVDTIALGVFGSAFLLGWISLSPIVSIASFFVLYFGLPVYAGWKFLIRNLPIWKSFMEAMKKTAVVHDKQKLSPEEFSAHVQNTVAEELSKEGIVVPRKE